MTALAHVNCPEVIAFLERILTYLLKCVRKRYLFDSTIFEDSRKTDDTIVEHFQALV